MLIRTLVSNALYLSLYDRELQPAINGGVISAALNSLNFIFDEWRDLIPYPVQYEFNDVDDLLNTQFVSIDDINYVIGNVQSPLIGLSLTRFNEASRIIGQRGTPTVYYFDPLAQSINVYPKPSQASYKFTLWGRAALGPLTLCSSLPANMPIYMANALQYELAKRLADEKGVLFSEGKDQTRRILLEQLKSKRQISLDTPLYSVFGVPSSDGIPPFPYYYYLSGGS